MAQNLTHHHNIKGKICMKINYYLKVLGKFFHMIKLFIRVNQADMQPTGKIISDIASDPQNMFLVSAMQLEENFTKT